MCWKFAIAFEQGRGAFVSFQNHFYALEEKKSIWGGVIRGVQEEMF
jgi:hypothetical protein